MPLRLNFRIEDRGGVMVLITTSGEDEAVRAASSAEVELWNALTRRFAAPARESYIRVNEQDLVSVIMERDHLRRQHAEVQRKNIELTNENSVLKRLHEQANSPHEAGDDRGASGREPTP